MFRLLISTGEVSGDLQGSLLVSALIREANQRSIPLELVALGGPRMQAAGAELIANTASIGAIGFWEALPLVIPTLRVQDKLDNFLEQHPPDALVLIDYMGPNIRLGNKLRNLFPSLPIVYYIAPQEWAWRLGDSGSTNLIKFTDMILAIFQAEADFYSQRGGNVVWVGHPMLDTLKELPSPNVALEQLGLNPDQKLLLLFPASRSQELRYLLPSLLQAAVLLQKHDPSLYVIVPAGLESFEEPLKKSLQHEGVIGRVLSAKETDKLKPFLFSAASIALGKSGTINMELALNDVPQVVGYKVSRITAFLARRILNFNVDHISPVNLLLKRRLVPELVQENFSPQGIADSAIPLLSESKERSSMLEGYSELRKKLGDPGVTDRAARSIIELISS